MPELDLTSLEEKVGQLFFIGISGPEIDDETASLLKEIKPGGVCLFGRNIRSREQTHRLLSGLWDMLPRPLLSVDQEGGLVDRLKRIFPAMPAAARLSSKGQAGEQARLMGEAMRLLGFNMDFAPCVDVMNAERGKSGNGLYSRTYGTTAEDATVFAAEFIESLRAEGILECIKHFPGLGASQVDSHEELPSVSLEPGELDEVDLVPYRHLVGSAAAVMVAHAAFPNDPRQETDADGRAMPSSLSRNFVSGLLRDDLGFDRVVITDDLEMGAIMRNYGIGQASKMALAAGVDMLAICADAGNIRTAYHAVLDAARAGEISAQRIDESVARIAVAKSNIAAPPEFNAERSERLGGEMAGFAAKI